VGEQRLPVDAGQIHARMTRVSPERKLSKRSGSMVGDGPYERSDRVASTSWAAGWAAHMGNAELRVGGLTASPRRATRRPSAGPGRGLQAPGNLEASQPDMTESKIGAVRSNIGK